MSNEKTQHDIGKDRDPRSGGDHPNPPHPGKIEQGTKPEEVRDKGDKADRPKP